MLQVENTLRRLFTPSEMSDNSSLQRERMPLPSNCTYQNPFGATIAAAPMAAAAPALAPGQGDHVFGDVLGTVETALQRIFGGGQQWQDRMRAYSDVMATFWTDLQTADFGHGAQPPLVNRNGAAEPDQHSHMFGGYSARLQWQLAEIVCSGFHPITSVEDRRIGGFSKVWKNAVLDRFDDLMNNLVDSTALNFYIAKPTQIRQANPQTVVHAPISLAAATTVANQSNGPGKAVVTGVLGRCASLRGSFEGLIGRFEQKTKTLVVKTNPTRVTWES